MAHKSTVTQIKYTNQIGHILKFESHSSVTNDDKYGNRNSAVKFSEAVSSKVQ